MKKLSRKICLFFAFSPNLLLFRAFYPVLFLYPLFSMIFIFMYEIKIMAAIQPRSMPRGAAPRQATGRIYPFNIPLPFPGTQKTPPPG